MSNEEDTLHRLALEVGRLMAAIRREHEEMSEEENMYYIVETSRGLDPTKNPEYKAFKHHLLAKTGSEVDRLRHLVKIYRFELDFVRKWKKERRNK